MWYVFLTLSVLTVITGFVYIFINRNNKKLKIAPINTVLCAVFVSDVLIFIPVYYSIFSMSTNVPLIIKTILGSMHHAIRLFVVDSDFEIIKEMVPDANPYLYSLYTSAAAILFVLSPIMTFGFIFSFFKNISAYRRYIMSYKKDVYIFSEINEKTVELALSIKNKFKNATVVFTNFNDNDILSCELAEKAKKRDAIIFGKDILAVNFKFHSKSKNIVFFIMGDDEANNIKSALEIINKYNSRKNTQLYVLSNEIEGELLLNSANQDKIKVRRISNIRAAIFNILQTKGEKLFYEARINPASKEKNISAAIIGLGKYGGEMVRALAWFCQMDGYKIEIDAFDHNPEAESCFSATCPELTDKQHNNKFDDPGEAQYRISIHPTINVDSLDFQNEIKKLKKTTYVFVALGNDVVNIRTAIKLRMLFEQMGIRPRIQAVVENSEQGRNLKRVKNYSGQLYEIECVGAINEIYSYENIINSELEQEALKRHMCWGNETDFWKFEYNYRSSMASALHKKMKKVCKIPGVDKIPSERTESEKQALRLMEHRRWNAYMRSEGYVYSPERNNLAKMHNCLVTFDLLSQKDKEKDDD